MKTLIYVLNDPRTGHVRYVGKTQRELPERMKEHRNVAAGGRRGLRQYCANWLRSLRAAGVEPGCVVVEEVPSGGDWASAEEFWIRYLRFLGCDLTNHTNGGDGLSGHKRPPDVIEKTASKLRGRTMPESAKEKMRAAWTPERRIANGTRRRSEKTSEAAKAKMSTSALARYRSPEELAACAARLAKCYRNSPEARAKIAWAKRRWFVEHPEERAKYAERMRQWRAKSC